MEFRCQQVKPLNDYDNFSPNTPPEAIERAKSKKETMNGSIDLSDTKHEHALVRCTRGVVELVAKHEPLR